MATLLAVVAIGPLCFGTGVVQHVAEVIFGFLVVSVLLDEVVFIWQLQNYREESQEWKNNICMKGSLENFYLVDVRLEEVWVVVFPQEVGCESI